MIEISLDASVAASDLPGGQELLNEFALNGGKKFRSRLVMTVADCLGITADLAVPCAIAAERVHNATLLHDDVIDESTERRGKVTLNANGRNRRAILGGDLLLAQALRDLAASGSVIALRGLLDVLVALSEGEWMQLEARHCAQVSERHLREVALKKTGSLIAWCCEAPALLASGPLSGPATQTALHNFGQHLGVAFQMLDDCIDFDPCSGKPFAQDLREGQINFVVCHLLERHAAGLPDIFSEAAIADLTRDSQCRLASSLGYALSATEIELAAARAWLERAELPGHVSARLEQAVLAPFLAQVEATRKRLIWN